MSVPNQRQITVMKEKTDKQNLYTNNSLAALDEAAGRLITAAGFKLYMYLAKNQNTYNFWLSSQDFQKWANVGIKAYRSAFADLVEEGYLIPKDPANQKETVFTFYDKSRLPKAEDPKEEKCLITIPPEQVAATREAQSKGFVF